MSSTLKATLHAIQHALLDASADIESLVCGDERLSARQRMAIYGSACQARFMEALAADFPALQTYIGDEAFAQLVKTYSEVYPSRSFSLRWLGRHLCEFLTERTPYRDHADLRELAKFEWTLCHAFDAADAEIVDASALALLAPAEWPELTLEFHASAKVIALHGNTVELWRELKAQKTPPAFQLDTRFTSWLIWRQDLKVLYRPLESIESLALDLFRRGKPFAAVCESLALLMDEEQVPMFAAGCLRQWSDDGLIIRASAC